MCYNLCLNYFFIFYLLFLPSFILFLYVYKLKFFSTPMIFFLFFCFAFAFEFQTHDMLEKIKLLHSKTSASTFYELLNVSQNATSHKITQAFRKATRGTCPYKGMSDAEYKKLVLTAYTVLRDHREDYDFVLGNGRMLFLNDKRNFCNNKGILILSLIFALIAVDFSIFIRRYLIYASLPPKKLKQFPNMYVYKLYKKIMRK
ncbi:hypothetical protein NUSPORA_02305 [Nucleospora cyclopteri]